MPRTVVETSYLGPSPERKIARVETSMPIKWLWQGINDFRRIPGLSLLYGVLFFLICYAFFSRVQLAPWINLGYLPGLVFVGPFLAAGLYLASRDIERGIAPTMTSSWRLIWQRKSYLSLFALMLTILAVAWVRFSGLLFAAYFDTLYLSTDAISNLLSSYQGIVLLGFFLGFGLLMATAVFVVSAIAIPLILDGDADFINSMITSYLAVSQNPHAMFLWAVIIVALIAIGMATWFVGLVLVFPVLGYATWHSYRDLIN